MDPSSDWFCKIYGVSMKFVDGKTPWCLLMLSWMGKDCCRGHACSGVLLIDSDCYFVEERLGLLMLILKME